MVGLDDEPQALVIGGGDAEAVGHGLVKDDGPGAELASELDADALDQTTAAGARHAVDNNTSGANNLSD
jgi:hypothetical protein